MTLHEEPAVVNLDDILDEEEHTTGRTGGQIALIAGLSVLGLAALSGLAVLILPVAAEVVHWMVTSIRGFEGV